MLEQQQKGDLQYPYIYPFKTPVALTVECAISQSLGKVVMVVVLVQSFSTTLRLTTSGVAPSMPHILGLHRASYRRSMKTRQPT